MTSPTPAVAAIYCRISNDADGRMLGVTRQERSCRRLAAQRGLVVTEVFVDNDVSAFSGARRPGYQRLLAALAEGRFGAVLAWDGDRLHRSTRELEDFIDIIEATGTVVVTVTSGEIDFSSATGRMQVRIRIEPLRDHAHRRQPRPAAHHLGRGRPRDPHRCSPAVLDRLTFAPGRAGLRHRPFDPVRAQVLPRTLGARGC